MLQNSQSVRFEIRLSSTLSFHQSCLAEETLEVV